MPEHTMLYKESELLPLSALQHLMFCERQCALIHVEQIWEENFFTAQGRILHDRVDRGGERPGSYVRVEYGLPLRSYRLGLFGRADAVEFHKKKIDGKEIWVPYPVEYKRGRSKPRDQDCDRVQLCAQAICLEEQLGLSINEGSLFYGKTRRRERVVFNDILRKTTEDAAKRLHKLISSGETPMAKPTKKCASCSLREACMPKLCQKRSVRAYIDTNLEGM